MTLYHVHLTYSNSTAHVCLKIISNFFFFNATFPETQARLIAAGIQPTKQQSVPMIQEKLAAWALGERVQYSENHTVLLCGLCGLFK